MELKVFKWEQDADGIVTLTWNDPGRSMNVLSGEAMRDLGEVIPKVAGDAASRTVSARARRSTKWAARRAAARRSRPRTRCAIASMA
jgi:enoyl-CoA hydratase/carnithine racemase